MLILQTILDTVPHLRFSGKLQQTVSAVVQLQDLHKNPSYLGWCSDKNMQALSGITCGSIVCSKNVPESYFHPACNYIIAEDPRLTFLQIVEHFFADKKPEYRIHPSAIIHPSAKISANVRIDEFVVIEEDVEIGEFSIIGAHSVLKKKTKVGSHVLIGCNNTIGGIGFGYQKNEQGHYVPMPHLGNVEIEDQVEIGNNNTIDRAVMGSTWLRKNCKIDNLVHIAHGVEIGENSLIIAKAMIAGSVKIGKNVWVAPSASVLNKLKVGDHAVIGMGAVVIRDVEAGATIVGNPGKAIKKND